MSFEPRLMQYFKGSFHFGYSQGILSEVLLCASLMAEDLSGVMPVLSLFRAWYFGGEHSYQHRVCSSLFAMWLHANLETAQPPSSTPVLFLHPLVGTEPQVCWCWRGSWVAEGRLKCRPGGGSLESDSRTLNPPFTTSFRGHLKKAICVFSS